MKKLLFPIFILLISHSMTAQSPRQKWVDSVYSQLSLKEKIGQLFMVAAYSGGEKYNEGQIQGLVDRKEIGGVIFMQGTAEAQARQTNTFQQSAKVPLLIGMDAEWGLGMRLTGVKNFPRQMTIGATREPKLMEQMATAIAYQCKRLGVHVNFAPVVDVNNNPNNPVINFRSFGDDREWVSRFGIAYMKGLQDNGVMACAKHFPGHGDVSTDSHHDLPIINKTRTDLKNLELYPFQNLIRAGIKSVMIAHLAVPALEPQNNLPSTLSPSIVTRLLQQEMGFNGLIFTDALNMKGVTKYYADGETDLKAFLAGNDVLLFSQDVPKAIQKIEAAIASGQTNMARLEKSVKKILAAKYDAGLHNFRPIEAANATSDLNRYTEAIFDNIAMAAVTLLKEENHVLDKLASHPKGNYAYLEIGSQSKIAQNDPSFFHNMLKAEFPNIKDFSFLKGQPSSQIYSLIERLKTFDAVVIGVHNLNLYPKDNYGLDPAQMALLKQSGLLNNSMVVVFGNPYLMKNFCDAKSSIVAYEENSSTYKAVIQILKGQREASGLLPVRPCGNNIGIVKQNTPSIPSSGIKTAPNQPSGVTNVISEQTNQSLIKDPSQLRALDQFINDAISKGAFPGCQIIALQNGQTIYHKNFGKFSYGSSPSVTDQSIYDVASVTKLAATTLAVMKLYEQGKISLNKTLGDYLPFVRGSNKAQIKISNVLLHQAGMRAWIPFYKSTLENGEPSPQIYSARKSALFSVPVAASMFMNKHYVDTVWKTILESPLVYPPSYVYSDLDFIFLQKVVESVSGMALDDYVAQQFYKPLGLQNTFFNAWKKGLTQKTVPTERDNYFRFQQIQGYVHDMAAAMLGGAAGHAGLFSTADDLAVIMQMLLNKGTYRGKQYFKPETVELFTGYRSSISRRGYGFDKPEKRAGDGGPASDYCSKQTFGHQGFTGTCVWADPATGIVFIFLSNRINPSADNNLITRMSIRTVAQDYIYKALGYRK